MPKKRLKGYCLHCTKSISPKYNYRVVDYFSSEFSRLKKLGKKKYMYHDVSKPSVNVLFDEMRTEFENFIKFVNVDDIIVPEIVTKDDSYYLSYGINISKYYYNYENHMEKTRRILTLNNMFFCNREHFIEWCKGCFLINHPIVECLHCGDMGHRNDFWRDSRWNEILTINKYISNTHRYFNEDEPRDRYFCSGGKCKEAYFLTNFDVVKSECLLCKKNLLSGNYKSFQHLCKDYKAICDWSNYVGNRRNGLYHPTTRKVINSKGENVSRSLCVKCVDKYIKYDTGKAGEMLKNIYWVLYEVLNSKRRGFDKNIVLTILSFASGRMSGGMNKELVNFILMR